MKKRIIPVILAVALLCGCNAAENAVSPAPSRQESSAAVSSAAASETSKPEQAESEKAESKEEHTASESENASSETSPAEDAQKPAASEAPEAQDTSSAAQSSEAASDESAPDEDVYAGTYIEETAGRGVMTISNAGSNVYSVTVNWPASAFETAVWELSGEFNGRAVLKYDNCKKTVTTYGEDGSVVSEEVVYEGGTGYLQMADRSANEITVNWADDMENIADGSVFLKQ